MSRNIILLYKYRMLNTPPTSYQNISRLTSLLLAHCEKHNITVWLEYGSLLGWRRSKNVIIWDYDGDVGVYMKDKARLLATFAAEKTGPYLLDEAYYSDDGCLALRYDDNENDCIDVIFYCDEEGTVNSKQSAEILSKYPCNYNYCYPGEWFYPLREDTFLGHRVYIPAQPEKILEVTYGDWQEYPAKYKDYIDEAFLQPPVRPLPEIKTSSYEELFKLLELKKEPFIIRKTALFHVEHEDYETLIKSEEKIKGYHSSLDWNFDLQKGADVWQKFQEGRLDINIVDSPISDTEWVPTVLKEYFDNKLGEKKEYGVCWILTNRPKITHFHTDPKYAGGYMKLMKGGKIWWCIVEQDLQYLMAKGHSVESVAELDLCDILCLEDYYLWGKIYVSKIEDGDFLWFPIDCLHKVITTEDSHGIGGYL